MAEKSFEKSVEKHQFGDLWFYSNIVFDCGNPNPFAESWNWRSFTQLYTIALLLYCYTLLVNTITCYSYMNKLLKLPNSLLWFFLAPMVMFLLCSILIRQYLFYTVFESTGWRTINRPGASNINTVRAGLCTLPCINMFLVNKGT